MKIAANRPELSDALTWACQVVPKNPQNLVLTGLRIVAANGEVHLSAYDFDVSHEATVKADVLTEGECLVPATFVRGIVARMRGEEIELVLDDDTLTVRSGRSAYTARVLKFSEFPVLPKSPPVVGVIDAADLLNGLGVVVHPIDDGSPHPQVRGLRIESTGDDFEMVGMSRFRIATVALPWVRRGDIAITVPSKAFLAAAKGMNGPVSIGANEGSVGLADGQRRVTMRALPEGFTDLWRKMCAADESAPSAILDAAELSDAVKRAGTLAGELMWLNVAFADGELVVDIDADEAGSGSDVLDAEVTGEARGVLNPTYLANALDVVPSGRVLIARPTGGGKPWVIQPLDHTNIRLAVMGKAQS